MAKKTKELDKEQLKTTKKKTSSTKKTTSTNKKTTTKKSSDITKKVTTKKSVASTKKNSDTSKKTTTRKKVVKKAPVSFQSEYYDLPYMYNKTVVKVLAQTPKMLFIYWEVSESDRKALIKSYGKNFFETTRPILIVYNDTLNYSFEVNIDDFANSWYLHIDDANCNYHVELGRKPISANIQNSTLVESSEIEKPAYIPYYIYITSSNEMASPNNKILFDSSIKSLKFKNVKTGQEVEKDINQFMFITNFGIFNIQDLYKYLYPNENFEYENIVLGNTSSGALSSSGMFSSQFK